MAAIAIFVSGANFSARTDEVSEDLSVGGAGAEKLQLFINSLRCGSINWWGLS